MGKLNQIQIGSLLRAAALCYQKKSANCLLFLMRERLQTFSNIFSFFTSRSIYINCISLYTNTHTFGGNKIDSFIILFFFCSLFLLFIENIHLCFTSWKSKHKIIVSITDFFISHSLFHSFYECLKIALCL
jgi:hypothetical protein